MGLTCESTGVGAFKENFQVVKRSPEDLVIALAGNPNTGKSTVFNSLTGLNQHTGNWPGKTVANAQGSYSYRGKNFVLVDLPGTYSLLANSVEEEIARDFICFGHPQATVVVTDATSLERNLNMVLQVLEITERVVVCVNLLDEAKRKKIEVDLAKLSGELGVPVIGTNARDGVGLEELKNAVYDLAVKERKTKPKRVDYGELIEGAIARVEPLLAEPLQGKVNTRWAALRLLENDGESERSLEGHWEKELNLHNAVRGTERYLADHALGKREFRDELVTRIIKTAESVHEKTVSYGEAQYNKFDRRLDNVLTSRRFGIPVMLLLLGVTFWLTIQGANYPSALLASGLFWGQDRLTEFFVWMGAPGWLHGILVLGVYRTLAWVISVMLPPMAIFFPLFTLLEDLGYLPRVAFNLDSFFKKACAHGKQALTMCMGFGCNAAGVTACRIIDSPRERAIAVITNALVPCNGRFPTLIALAAILAIGFTGGENSLLAAISILAVVVFGVMMTLVISKILSKTVLKGIPSSFTLELPPYRKPRVGRIIIHSIVDRTLFVLGRAVMVAAPAGAFIWLMANVYVGGQSILGWGGQLLNPFARLLGLDGYILLAFILGFPANEIVIPILIMSYMATGQMVELDSIAALRAVFLNNGWTWLTVVCTMLFTLNHWPCGTTVLTTYKETKSVKHTLLAVAVPTMAGIFVCFIVAQGSRLLGLV